MNGHLENSQGRSNPPEKLERIRQAAWMLGGKIYTGNTHVDALYALKKANPELGRWTDSRANAPKDGFITNTGRFVDRIEAGEIAVRAEQIDSVGQLQSEDIVEGN